MSDKKYKFAAKSFFGRPFCLLCVAAAQKIAHAALTCDQAFILFWKEDGKREKI